MFTSWVGMQFFKLPKTHVLYELLEFIRSTLISHIIPVGV